jgi:hypothetical protein
MTDKEDYIVIPLTQGLIAWISLEDADIAGWGWYAKAAGSKKFPAFYAMYSSSAGGLKVEYYLHDLIWSRAFDTDVPHGFLVDHINRDKLDNRRLNLRLATKSQNEQNKTKRRSNTTSRYKGVVKMSGRKKCWRATLTEEGYNIHIGTFYSEKEAAIAYNQAAYERWGEFAVMNDVNEVVRSEDKEPAEELIKYKKRYERKKHGHPRNNPNATLAELRKTGRPVGRPRKNPDALQKDLRATGKPPGRPIKWPRSKAALKKAKYRAKLRERNNDNL